MTYKQVLNYLYSLDSPKYKPGLERISNLLNKLGNPQQKLKCIHVAGTNGKGSVCAMLFYALREAGYSAGLYTSPHLKRFNERIRVNDHYISDKEIVEYYLKIKKHITDQSFFEITTALAFLYFADKNADYAVIEVGLGGRLDATNVITPLVSVITNIDYDHTEQLGRKLSQIAYEKAGVIKRNIPVVTGVNGIALKTIRMVSEKNNSPLIMSNNIMKINNVNLKHLNGSFQQSNASVAITTINTLKKYYSIKFNNHAIKGLENTKWPGRLQFISENVLVDCAHNDPGIKTLANELNLIKDKKDFENLIFVFGVLNDKNIKGMLNSILKLNPSAIIFTEPKNKRAVKIEELSNLLEKINKNKIDFRAIKNPKQALKSAKETAEKNDLIVVAGSIYLVGELIDYKNNKKRKIIYAYSPHTSK